MDDPSKTQRNSSPTAQVISRNELIRRRLIEQQRQGDGDGGAVAGDGQGIRVGRDVVVPGLKVGALSGIAGALSGSIYAIYRSQHPRLFTVMSGLTCAHLGFTFTTVRILALHNLPPAPASNPHRNELWSSALAGGIAGLGVGVLQGRPRAIIPGGIQFALVGAVGQMAYYWADASHTRAVEVAPVKEEGKKKTLLEHLASMKWTGFEKLSDHDYADMLQGKADRLDVEVRMIHEQIKELRRQQKQEQRDKGAMGDSTAAVR